MPKTVIDYSNTIFYKISCKDDSISDLYIGHTTNFVQRKNGHKQSCNNPKSANHACKLYEFIRQNGGWDNWRMDIIAHHECHDHSHARTKEQEYFIYYHATLNSIEPMPRPIPNWGDDDIRVQVCDLNEHGQTNKHPTDANNVIRRTPTEYVCKKCHYNTANKKDYCKHLQTKKHNATDTINLTQHQPVSPSLSCECGKKYNHRASLWNHRKRCKIQYNVGGDVDAPTSAHTTPTTHLVDTSLVLELCKQNQDIKSLMMEQSKQFAEQHSKLLEAIHGITNNIR